MNYRELFRMYKPMDERKSLSYGQFRVMRIIALIIFTLLVIISYTSFGKPAPQKEYRPKLPERATVYTIQLPADASGTMFQIPFTHERY
jgi:hypothetical protein